MPGLEGDFTGDPLLQQLKEYLSGDHLPVDVRTGEVVTAQTGVVPPNLGSNLSPWGRVFAGSVVIGGVEVSITDLANFSPFIITREASAPATGQHRQVFHWPFETLTGALIHVVGPQGGGDGSPGGGYYRPNFFTPQSPSNPTGFGRVRAGDYGANGVLSSDPDDAQALITATMLAGESGDAETSTFAVTGLSLGDEIALGFGKGGAGGLGGLGSVFPTTLVSHPAGNYYPYGLGKSEPTTGDDGAGVTWIQVRGRFELVGWHPQFSGLGATYPKEVFADFAAPGDDVAFTNSTFKSLPGGVSANVTSRPFESPPPTSPNTMELSMVVGGSDAGLGGAIGISVAGNTGTPLRAGAGGDGNAGHDGFVLIYPRI